MANSLTGFTETLFAASAEAAANMSTRFRNAMIDRVYWGYSPANGESVGNTINIIVPTVNEGDVFDIQAGDIQSTDYAYNSTSLTFAHKFSTSFPVRQFDQLRTPADLRTTFLDTRMEAVIRKVNRAIANLATSTNFSTYTTVTGGNDVFTRSHFATAWAYLANGGVPVDDADNLFLLTHPTVYGNMTLESSLVQESIAGLPSAEAGRQAKILTQYNAEIVWDQQVPVVSAGVYSALFYHRYAIAARAAIEPSMADGSIAETIVYPRQNLPVKVQVWNSGERQGVMVHLACVFGFAVVRPEFGVYMQTT